MTEGTKYDLFSQDFFADAYATFAQMREHIARIFANNPTLRFTARSLHVADDFAVCEWTASTGSKEWDGVDVFPLRGGKIARKDVYSSSHRPREP